MLGGRGVTERLNWALAVPPALLIGALLAWPLAFFIVGVKAWVGVLVVGKIQGYPFYIALFLALFVADLVTDALLWLAYGGAFTLEPGQLLVGALGKLGVVVGLFATGFPRLLSSTPAPKRSPPRVEAGGPAASVLRIGTRATVTSINGRTTVRGALMRMLSSSVPCNCDLAH